MIEFKDCYVRTYWLASFFFPLSSKILCCLSLKFTTCIIIIMHQKGSISDSLQLSATDTCWWLLLLRWSAGPPEQRLCHFNCMIPGLAYYRYFFRKRTPTGFISNLEVTGVPENPLAHELYCWDMRASWMSSSYFSLVWLKHNHSHLLAW